MSVLLRKHTPGGGTYAADQHPAECPICHYSIEPTEAWSKVKRGTSQLEYVFSCPRKECQSLFIARYQEKARPVGTSTSAAMPHLLREVVPQVPRPTTFPKEVADTSPTFVTVYNQAMAAEAHGLDQLTGIGLRKALEFLVKDFLIAQNASLKPIVEKKLLGACISDHVGDDRIKQCALRAAWLGNDETHYVRKWVDKDIQDLKMLITLTANWIHSSLVTAEYEKTMPKT